MFTPRYGPKESQNIGEEITTISSPPPHILFKRLSKYCIHVVIKFTPRILFLKKVTILEKKLHKSIFLEVEHMDQGPRGSFYFYFLEEN